MKHITNQACPNRRDFITRLFAGAAGITFASLTPPARIVTASESSAKSRVSLVTGRDQREAAFQALKPLESDIKKGIKGKKIVIKVNMGQVKKEWWLNATDVNTVRGILDFLSPLHDGDIIVAESTAAGAQSTFVGFENYGYMPLKREYKVKLLDLNEEPFTTKWILNENKHPLGISIINTYLDPDVYLISATRLKTHNCVIATLSLKNVVMGAPINHFTQKSAEGRNEKPKMHSGGNRGLSFNMFLLAHMGVQPDLAVLDGVVGMEGNGPVDGIPIEHGVVIASTDWLAADRLGVELMGMDYSEVKYMQWCASAGMGQDNFSKITIIGPEYKNLIKKYKLNENIEWQREWIYEDYKNKEKP